MNWFLNLLQFWKRWETTPETTVTPVVLPKPIIIQTMDPTLSAMQIKIHEKLVYYIGKRCTLDASVPHEKGCAEAVSFLLAQLGIIDGVRGIAGTLPLLQWVEAHKDLFEEIQQAEESALIINATDTGNGSVEGHTGFFGAYDLYYPNDWAIVSNDSNTGLLREQWSLTEWDKWYVQRGGIKSRIFRVKG